MYNSCNINNIKLLLNQKKYIFHWECVCVVCTNAIERDECKNICSINENKCASDNVTDNFIEITLSYTRTLPWMHAYCIYVQ